MKTLLLSALIALNCWVAAAQVNCTLTAGVAPLNEFAVAGETVTFNATVTGGSGNYSMYWWSEGRRTLLSAYTGPNTGITIANVLPADAGLIYLVVYDLGTGCGTLTAGKLFVATPSGRLFPKELDFLTES
jgi:hypothetical protein